MRPPNLPPDCKHRWKVKKTITLRPSEAFPHGGYELLERCRRCTKLRSRLVLPDMTKNRIFAKSILRFLPDSYPDGWTDDDKLNDAKNVKPQ